MLIALTKQKEHLRVHISLMNFVDNQILYAFEHAVGLHFVGDNGGGHVDDSSVATDLFFQTDLVSDQTLADHAPTFLASFGGTVVSDTFSYGSRCNAARLRNVYNPYNI